jgi:hypothetical protein
MHAAINVEQRHALAINGKQWNTRESARACNMFRNLFGCVILSRDPS